MEGSSVAGAGRSSVVVEPAVREKSRFCKTFTFMKCGFIIITSSFMDALHKHFRTNLVINFPKCLNKVSGFKHHVTFRLVVMNFSVTYCNLVFGKF